MPPGTEIIASPDMKPVGELPVAEETELMHKQQLEETIAVTR